MLTQTAAVAEVGDESVTQILGGEIVQGCGYETSSDRGNVVSFIMSGLKELRQRRPISLSEETLVELASETRPPLLWFDLGRIGEAYLHLGDVPQGAGRRPVGDRCSSP
jgi:hypothetical protein